MPFCSRVHDRASHPNNVRMYKHTIFSNASKFFFTFFFAFPGAASAVCACS